MARIDGLFSALVKQGGSDLHLSAGAPPMARIHGDMRLLGDALLTRDDTAALILEILPEEVHAAFEADHDVDFVFPVPGTGRFRANAFVDHRGIGAVFRFIPAQVPGFEQLGLPPAVRSFCSAPRGIVLVTGPTGAGKSTTLAAMIDEINRTRSEHIITIEDPIEFVHENRSCLVNQREVGPHTRSFARALRAALREDPDIILVGEMRDLETTTIALETAETGHLVLSTLHTTSAVGTIERVVEGFPAEAQGQVRSRLAAVLQGVVCQTLLKRKDGKGLVPALEVLVATPAIAAQIREGKTHQINSSIQTGGRLGMTVFNDSLVRLVSRGVIDVAVACEAATDKEGLLRGLQVANVAFDPSALKGGSPAPAVEKAR
ncbi:MAG: type IV pilus twitching motility protein PilT [Planctomycetes bacterium]|nr:type IV pilus twitching motility protein PilT [Planctomycetota bacterium]